MSIRSRTTASAHAPVTAVEFRSEFLNAAPAAPDHGDTVTNILSRLDQLQASILPDAPTPKAAARADPQDLHSRLQHLEDVHENTLHQLGAKLNLVEQKIRDNREAETLMSQISSKFSMIESRLQSQAHLHDRVTQLETQMRPDPEQERILARINSKLDLIEEQKRNRALGSRYESEESWAPRAAPRSLGAREDVDRAEYLQSRIEKLQALRARYQDEEDELRE